MAVVVILAVAIFVASCSTSRNSRPRVGCSQSFMAQHLKTTRPKGSPEVDIGAIHAGQILVNGVPYTNDVVVP